MTSGSLSATSHIVVIGAGIVGVCCAAYLQRDGHRVTLIDPAGPGEATSSGNAGGFAVSEVVPLSGPGTLRQVPGWLLDPLGPLIIRWRHLPHLAPWLWRFWRAGTRRRFAEITKVMSELMRSVYADYDVLVDSAGLRGMLYREGALTLYDNAKALDRDQSKWGLRGKHGVRFERVDKDRIRELEPLVAPHFEHGVFVPDWSYVEDPYRFTRGLAEACLDGGAELVPGKVVAIELAGEEGARAVRLDDGSVVSCDQVVVAAGVWSQVLARQLGSPVPMESERGYHVTLPNACSDLRKFLLSASGGFVILPMRQGIRVAGTVELASLEAPPNYDRAWVLIDKARRILPDLDTEGATVWMGHRPALPDTVPVISRSPHYRNVYFAFGHGHLGLTLGATSGRIIADLIAARDPGIDTQPLRVDRF